MLACGTAPSAPERPVENHADRDPPRAAPPPSPAPAAQEETVLTSRRWKYAVYFNRMKRAIHQSWAPTPAMAGGTPLSDLETRVIIVLTPAGDLIDVTIEQSSGFPALDAEAQRAVRAAAPFANPPPGLLDPGTNTIRFPFSFWLDH